MKVLSRNNNLTLECCLDIAESDKTISCSPIRKSETLWTKKKNHVFTFYLKERFFSAFGRLRISGKSLFPSHFCCLQLFALSQLQNIMQCREIFSFLAIPTT